ncbi:hypothetical protein ABFS82_04G017800 [Erythranthe guttata]|uniref:protein indeterminate-domain 2-like n=1 Tax=Erythranthe guttata TaxID=4155 RepID=UPI00064D96A0|nr:PREDICTED: protein indeterminate-domain 2-like [Erythranthe guttata]|eukprot:XP_012833280.1 PREDICTED: protein indeterminate-domain 2-like [Erythranthe guttata]
MSNITGDDEGSFSSGEVQQQQQEKHSLPSTTSNGSSTSHHRKQPPPSPPAASASAAKKKRNLPGNPDPTAEVVALSPTTLMATNRFVCEICNKGFQRDQNLQLHRRGHNLPWKLRQRSTTEVRKRVYICPEPTCVHHNPARALGDLTGIKKHFSRKHGEKKWKCDKCSKKYAVQSDWKAHQKTCGTREYKCDCGTIFSRRDSFITHRAFCDALAEENSKVNHHGIISGQSQLPDLIMPNIPLSTNANMGLPEFNNNNNPLKSLPQELIPTPFKPMNMFSTASGALFGTPLSSSGLHLSSNAASPGYNPGPASGSAHMSATALLQKAAQMGASATNSMNSPMIQKTFVTTMAGPDQGPGPVSRPTYDNNFHHHHHGGQHEQAPPPFNGGGGFAGQLLFEGGGSAMSDMMMYGGMLMGGGNGDQNSPAAGIFLKNAVEVQEGSDQSCGILQGRNNGGNNGMMMGARNLARFGGGNDMTTVDFMGVGGSNNMHDQRLEMDHNHQHQIMQLMHNNPFHNQQQQQQQQQLSQGDSDHGGEKPLYNTF